MDWVKFKRSLTKGAKRGLARASRFIYLELALDAGDLAGEIELPAGLDIVDAIHDIIGGDRKEIAKAWPALSTPAAEGDDPMLREVTEAGRRILRVVTWADHNPVDASRSSTARVRRHRARLEGARSDNETDETFHETLHPVPRNEDPGFSETRLAVSGTDATPSRACARAPARSHSLSSSVSSQERESVSCDLGDAAAHGCADWIRGLIVSARLAKGATEQAVSRIVVELAAMVDVPEVEQDLGAAAVENAIDVVSRTIALGKLFSGEPALIELRRMLRMKIGDARERSRELRAKRRDSGAGSETGAPRAYTKAEIG